MKLLCRTFFLLVAISFRVIAFAQDASSVTALRQKLKTFEQRPNYTKDTAYMNALIDLAYEYSFVYPDSALLILGRNAQLCKALQYKKGEVNNDIIFGDAYKRKGVYEKALESYETALQLAKNIAYRDVFSLIANRIGTIHLNQGNYPEALSKFYESLKAAESLGDNNLIGATLNNIATVQFYQDKFNDAENTYRQRLKIAQDIKDTSSMSHAYNNLGEVNLKQKNPLKALGNLTTAYNLALQVNDREMVLNATLSIAEAYYTLDSLPKSISLFQNALKLSRQTNDGILVCNALVGLAKARYRQGLLKEALANGLEGLQRAEKMGQVQLMRDANEIVYTIYEAQKDGNHALKYYKMYKVYSDSMNNLASQSAVAIEKNKYEFSKKENEFDRKTLQQHWLTFSAFAGVLLLAVILWIILRNRNRLRQTYAELQQKNAIIETGKLKAEDTLFKLQATQAQLIQSEKMASLGELTAGIAHEIQNPLNFVNNFSDVNTDLLEELREESEKGNLDEVKAIAADIIKNEQKINHHGKRAEAIVKGMLLHSRKNTGQKEPTDINALCDEYLRLSYHGLRAKDKNFNADFKTDFDGSIGKVSVVAQDMGRVLLNLFNNAFYAVSLHSKGIPPSSLKGEIENLQKEFIPMVTVTTKQIPSSGGGEAAVLIRVRDNGSGMPKSIADKIFQPFFTTKPAGEGTGLGLSLSYDIVVKGHGGEIKVDTQEGAFTEFAVILPAK